jgi:hypothetical protein
MRSERDLVTFKGKGISGRRTRRTFSRAPFPQPRPSMHPEQWDRLPRRSLSSAFWDDFGPLESRHRRCSAEVVSRPHDCPLALGIFPLMRTSSSHSRQSPSPAVAAEIANTCAPICLFAPGQSGALPSTRPLKCMSLPQQSISGALSLGRRCPFRFVRQQRIRAVTSSVTLFSEPGLPARSFDGRTDCVASFLLLPPVGFV